MTRIDALFIAPHLDDAIYSCGGTIQHLTQAGKSVAILTTFAGPPPTGELSDFAQHLHERWGNADPAARGNLVAARQKEDVAAAWAVGASAIHMEYPDCIYRQANGEWLYASEAAIFETVADAEADLVQQLIEDIFRLDGVDDFTQLYAPLGIGNHVDHQLVHQALLQCEDVLFYEDYPYAENDKALLPIIRDNNWQPHYVTLTAEEISAKTTAMATYKSQLTTFWTNEDHLNKNVAAYWQRRGRAERYWKFVGALY